MRGRRLAGVLAGAGAVALGAVPAAVAAVETTRDAGTLTAAMAAPGTTVGTPAFDSIPDPEDLPTWCDPGDPDYDPTEPDCVPEEPHGVAGPGTDVPGFPSSGPGFAILTTGDAALADDENVDEGSGASLSGEPVRGENDFDVSVLRIPFTVPPGASCLSFDFRFLSEEYPEFVGSGVSDTFIAELDDSTWTTTASEVSAPDNFALGENDELIGVDSTAGTFTEARAEGTTYDGATRVLRAATPVTPGQHELFLSIFDQSDRLYDSAVFADNLAIDDRAGNQCEPGVAPHDGLSFPVPSFTAQPDPVLVGGQVAFDASGSSDADGTVERYDWDFGGDGTYELQDAGPEVEHAFTGFGEHTVGLRVTDDDNLARETTRVVNVIAPPEASFSFEPQTPLTGQLVTFDSSDSRDPDGTPAALDRAWDLDDDGTFDDATGATASATFAAAGEHTVRLRVTDEDGLQDVTSRAVLVTQAPDTTPPVATITSGPRPRTVKRTARFGFVADEAASFECRVTGRKAKAAWRNFTPCTSPKTYRRLKPGRYVFAIRATDLAGNSGLTVSRSWKVI